MQWVKNIDVDLDFMSRKCRHHIIHIHVHSIHNMCTHTCTLTHTGAEIDQIKKNYVESQSRRSSKLKGLGDELHGVHKIMFENIDAVLQRGELISG